MNFQGTWMICDVRKPWVGQVFTEYLTNIVPLLQTKAFEQKNRKNYNLRLIWFLCRGWLTHLTVFMSILVRLPWHYTTHADIVIFTVSCFLRSVTFVSCKAIDIPKKALSALYLFQLSKHEHDKTKHCFELMCFVALHWFLLTSYLHTKPQVNADGFKAFLDGI